MRLTDEQRRAVRQEVDRVFGRETVVRLFGSRVDDDARGGDIDLYIETEGSPREILDRELDLQARLVHRLGERKIDIVVHPRDQPPRPIDEHARRTGVRL